MKVKVGIILVASLAIEVVNFFFLAPPIDVGYEPGTPWYIQLVGLQWVALHAVGLFPLDWFERLTGCHKLNIVMGCRRIDISVLFAGGYFTTTFLLLAMTFGFHWLLRWKHKRLIALASQL